MDNDKKRIKTVIEEVDGQQVPSPDSLSEVLEPTEAELTQENQSDGHQLPEGISTSEIETPSEEPNILSEETKDGMFEEATPVPTHNYERHGTDVGIVQPSMPIEPKKGNKMTLLLIMVMVALVVGLLAGGIYVYSNGIKNDAAALPSPTPEQLQEPTATPVPSTAPISSTELSKLKVNILNGSGKIGEAGKVKTLIEKEGFKVTSTGNAASFDFTDTVIAAKEGMAQAVIDQLKDTLSKNYKVKIGDSLAPTSTFDIVITVGSK